MPLRFIGKALGGIVHYDKGNLTITLDNQVKEWTLETITSKAKAGINNKGYSFSEVCKIAEEKMGLLGAYRFDDDIYINNELAYSIQIEVIAGDWPRTSQIYIGSETLNIYDYNEKFIMSIR